MLSLTVFLPLAGALALLLVPNRDGARDGFVRWAALVVSLATFVVTVALWAGFNPTSADFQFVERYPWIPAFGID